MRFFCSFFKKKKREKKNIFEIFLRSCKKSSVLHRCTDFFVLNHNHVICIPSPSHTCTHTHARSHVRVHLPCLLQAQKIPVLFFFTVGQPKAQRFRHLCTSVPTINGHRGWSGGAKMPGKLQCRGVLMRNLFDHQKNRYFVR